MRSKDRIAGTVSFLVFAFTFILSLKFPEIPKLLPAAIGLIGMILSAVLVIKSIIGKYADVAKPMEKAAIKTLIIAFSSIAAYVFAITTIGYYVSTFIFIIGFSALIDRKENSGCIQR